MKSLAHVIPGASHLPVTVFGADQPCYRALYGYRVPGEEGVVLTRWRLTLRERLRLLLFGDLWLSVMTFCKPFQPVKLDVKCPVGVSEPWGVEQ